MPPLRVIFDRLFWFRVSFDVCFSPKATYLLRGNEMTRWANTVTNLWKSALRRLLAWHLERFRKASVAGARS